MLLTSDRLKNNPQNDSPKYLLAHSIQQDILLQLSKDCLPKIIFLVNSPIQSNRNFVVHLNSFLLYPHNFQSFIPT